jgi:hypothetical protein
MSGLSRFSLLLNSSNQMDEVHIMDGRIFCYRPNGTCYAVLTPSEWKKLRHAKTLDAELQRRRESGVIIEVKPHAQR